MAIYQKCYIKDYIKTDRNCNYFIELILLVNLSVKEIESVKSNFQINAEGKFDIDKELEEVRKIVKNDDDYKSMESVSKVCLSG